MYSVGVEGEGGGGEGGKGFVFTESLCRVVPACWWHCHKGGGFTHDCNN